MKIIGLLLGFILVTESCTPRPSVVEMQTSAAPTTNAPAKALPAPVSSSFIETTVPAQTASVPEKPLLPLTLEQRLDKRAVTDEHFARRELYSWTTSEQINELRQTKMLLVATGKTHGAPSPYSRLLSQLANGKGAGQSVAKLLSEHPGLTKRRYAWPNPFATAVPLGERSYGHALLHIVLKEGAVLVKLDPLETDPFAFVDLDNKSVPLDDILPHPERIAAVFHVRRKPEGGPRFREYIVCNESMIARWSVDTSHEQSIVEQESALITELLQSPLTSTLGKDDLLDANAAWSRTLHSPTLLDKWRATLAFDSPKYKPSKARLTAISESLAAYEKVGEPLEHAPSIAFSEKLKP